MYQDYLRGGNELSQGFLFNQKLGSHRRGLTTKDLLKSLMKFEKRNIPMLREDNNFMLSRVLT